VFPPFKGEGEIAYVELLSEIINLKNEVDRYRKKCVEKLPKEEAEKIIKTIIEDPKRINKNDLLKRTKSKIDHDDAELDNLIDYTYFDLLYTNNGFYSFSILNKFRSRLEKNVGTKHVNINDEEELKRLSGTGGNDIRQNIHILIEVKKIIKVIIKT